MTPEERVQLAAEAAQRSRTRAAQDELRHLREVDRLEAMKTKARQQRAQLLGGLLIEAAERTPECRAVLATLVTQARSGKDSKILDGWDLPALDTGKPAPGAMPPAARPSAPELPL